MSFTTSLVGTVQRRLADLGYYAGMIDGAPGPLTSAAMTLFKRTNGLAPRDYPGPLTITRLFSAEALKKPAPAPRAGEPAWLTEARRLIGTDELPGAADNPVIMGWARDLDQWYPGDDTPWCGLFVAHCMAAGAPGEPQAFNRLGARDWLEFGAPVEPSVGAIAVFWRTHPTKSWNGHVGFIVGGDRETLHVLGGNQSNTVNVARVSRARLLGCRAPAGWSGDTALRPMSTVDLSTNEV